MTEQAITKKNSIPVWEVHILYGLSAITGWWLLLSFLAAVAFFAHKKDLRVKSHLRYLIITNIIPFAASFLIGFIAGFIDGSMEAAYSSNPGILDKVQNLMPYIVWVLIVWYYLRLIGGWVNFFRKRPIEGFFGISLRKKMA